MMPASLLSSPQTGSDPTFSFRIFSAAWAMLSPGRQHSTPGVMMSRIRMTSASLDFVYKKCSQRRTPPGKALQRMFRDAETAV
jgi:hypothetical protein